MARLDLVLLHAPSVYDFRRRAILYGPISDVVPSTPVFEMYPIGFSTLADYLERHGFRVRIVNLALRMLRDPRFDAERAIARLDPLAFGIDLHWLAHAQGSLAVAALVKVHHPQTPVIFGGFSSSYFCEELLSYPQVDYVLRGDSTEEPLRQLMECIREGGDPHQVPNLAYRRPLALSRRPDGPQWEQPGTLQVNPISYVPSDIDEVTLDYSNVVRAVARYRDLLNNVPFINWLEYPITAALNCRGCTMNCLTCGGSSYTFARTYGRASGPAFRSPELLAQDMRNMGRFSRGPIMLLGDLRQAGDDYVQRFLAAVSGLRTPVIVELFQPAERAFLQDVARALPNLYLEVSLESHDPEVRRAFGKGYGNEQIEATLAYGLEAGCKRLDVFFLIGLPRQTYESVLSTVDYCEDLIKRLDPQGHRPGDKARLYPLISPLAPFLDPGSRAFEEPERYGYRVLWRTLEEHRQALLQPSWKYVLNYETEWMTRDQIVDATYEAGLRLNRLKARYGLIAPQVADAVETRILAARQLMAEIDEIMALPCPEEREKSLLALKLRTDRTSMSTVCEKRELELPMGLLRFNLPAAAWFILTDWVRQSWNALPGRRRRKSDT